MYFHRFKLIIFSIFIFFSFFFFSSCVVNFSNFSSKEFIFNTKKGELKLKLYYNDKKKQIFFEKNEKQEIIKLNYFDHKGNQKNLKINDANTEKEKIIIYFYWLVIEFMKQFGKNLYTTENKTIKEITISKPKNSFLRNIIDNKDLTKIKNQIEKNFGITIKISNV